VLIFGGALGSSIFLRVLIGIVIFLSVAYGLYLYGAVSHRGVSVRVNPIPGFRRYQKLLRLLHFVPLVILIIRVEVLVG